MLFGLTWFIGLTKPIYLDFSVKDIILFFGGGFLIFKSVLEISHKINGNFDEKIVSTKIGKFKLSHMADCCSRFCFFCRFNFYCNWINGNITINDYSGSNFYSFYDILFIQNKDIIDRYPSLEILALCFLILIGFTLILEAFHYDVPKGFIYFALFFTLGVELINIRFRRVSLKRVKIKK